MSTTNLDELFVALEHAHRRYALYRLRRAEICDVEDLIRQVAAWETGRPTRGISADEVDRLRVDFHHNHLEVLRDAGCVEYDERSETLRYRNPPEPLPRLLDVASSIDHPEER